MSYIRYNHPLVYVEGNSNDYVFYSVGDFVEDYGNISDTGFVELLFDNWQTEDKAFKEHLLKRLAARLNVKLRDHPLTDEEYDKLEEENMEKSRKEMEQYGKKDN